MLYSLVDVFQEMMYTQYELKVYVTYCLVVITCLCFLRLQLLFVIFFLSLLLSKTLSLKGKRGSRNVMDCVTLGIVCMKAG